VRRPVKADEPKYRGGVPTRVDWRRPDLASASADACATLRAAVGLWTGLGSPSEIAIARTLLGQAHRAAGVDAAVAMFDQARPHLRPAAYNRARSGERTNKENGALLHLSDEAVANHLANTALGTHRRGG